MTKIKISKETRKSVVGSPTHKIVGENVIVQRQSFKNGNKRFETTSIVQISETGVYCSNDEFYAWHLFK
jgi:hypothetical protein